MKVPEAESKFFKIGPNFASNAFVSFKNTPKRFQISFKVKSEKNFSQKSRWEAGFYYYVEAEISTKLCKNCLGEVG